MTPAASLYLDSLRAIAANLVIASHVLGLYFGVKDPYSLGNLGVAVFFLLSGFLITQSMLSWSQRPEPRLPGFLADRTARVFTPYVPALILIAVVDLLIVGTRHGAAGSSTGLFAFLGNLLLLQDHSGFQLLELAGLDLPWRIRPYNTAEPFWTVAIEMWIYVSMGLFFFCILLRERVNPAWAAALALVSFPVLIWNAAAGGGKSLSLIWMLGAIAGVLLHRWRGSCRWDRLCADTAAGNRTVAYALMLFGAIALAGRAAKVGFQPYDFQSAALMAMILFGVYIRLLSVEGAAPALKKPISWLASYSYSLYLIHNTALIVVLELFEFTTTWLRVVLGVALAHCCAYALYIAFERHYRTVAQWLRPRFERALQVRGSSPADAAGQASSLLPTTHGRVR